MIEARSVHKHYKSGTATLEVLKGIGLRLEPGESIAITGPSGAGKSTLLLLLAGLDVPTQGEVFWEGGSLARLKDAERASLRNRMVGFVFQFYHLLPELTALENVMLPGLLNGLKTRTMLRARARTCLEQVGLSARAHHKPGQLSGGELQRVAVARAIVNEPRVLFCDEPTGNLDSQTGAAVTDLLFDVHRTHGASLVIVTHEAELAQRTQRHIVLRDGAIISETKNRESVGGLAS